MEKIKTVKEKKELYIEFSEDEMKELGWKENQKLSMTLNSDNSILIQPLVTVELDTSSWSKEVFEMLVELSLEKDKTVNEVIVDILMKYINIEDIKNKIDTQLICE